MTVEVVADVQADSQAFAAAGVEATLKRALAEAKLTWTSITLDKVEPVVQMTR